MKYNKEDLEKLILIENKSYSSIGEMYNVSGYTIKKSARALGVKLPFRRTINTNKKNIKFKRNSLVNIKSDSEFKKIIESSSTWKEIGIKLGYKTKGLSQNIRELIINRCEVLNISLNIRIQIDVGSRRKGELFDYSKNWQCARSSIRKDAQSRYRSLHPNPCCVICGYKYHTEIAHIKSVSSFDNNVLVSEINSIENLIELCPNHHWEFDNGLLVL